MFIGRIVSGKTRERKEEIRLSSVWYREKLQEKDGFPSEILFEVICVSVKVPVALFAYHISDGSDSEVPLPHAM